MKTHQHFALFSDITYRQARPVAIAPSGANNCAHQVVGFDFANVQQVVLKYALLDRNLRTNMQVLHFATAAGTCVHPKVGAPGSDALRRFVVNLHHHRFFKRWFFAVNVDRHDFVRQRTFDENYFAIRTVRNTLSLDVQRFDSQQVGRVIFGYRLW